MSILGILVTSAAAAALDTVAGSKVKKIVSSATKDLSPQEKLEVEELKKVYLKGGENSNELSSTSLHRGDDGVELNEGEVEDQPAFSIY